MEKLVKWKNQLKKKIGNLKQKNKLNRKIG